MMKDTFLFQASKFQTTLFSYRPPFLPTKTEETSLASLIHERQITPETDRQTDKDFLFLPYIGGQVIVV